jgi:hypothetical protein
VISEGFGRMEKVLNRLQFLAETSLPLDSFRVALDLDREYLASEIGHFRAFCSLELKEPKRRILGYLFGATDNPKRRQAKSIEELDLREGGIGKGLCGGHWEERLLDRAVPDPFTTIGRYTATSSGFVSVGLQKVRVLVINFGYDSLIRIPPYLLLSDVDEAVFALFLNRSLANKLKAVRVYGNEYKLAEYSRESMRLDSPLEDPAIPMCFATAELADEWVRVMHDLSPFRLSFSEKTPLRIFPATEIEGP